MSIGCALVVIVGSALWMIAVGCRQFGWAFGLGLAIDAAVLMSGRSGGGPWLWLAVLVPVAGLCWWFYEHRLYDGIPPEERISQPKKCECRACKGGLYP